jgi:prepilin signal peptidase PulO-like enzyme (type II secretory pathway)
MPSPPIGPAGLSFVFFLFGLALGSFGNVLLYRVPDGRTIMGRSECRYCRRTLSSWELIPVVSYLFLRGRCAGCGLGISAQYPLVELTSGLVFVAALLHRGFDPLSGALLGVALWLLLLIAVVDAQTSSIPDAFNIPFVLISALYAGLVSQFDLGTGVPAIVVGAGFFFIQWAVSRGRWVGSGDIFLGAGAGALLGSWEGVMVFLFASYITGAAVASVLIFSKKKTVGGSLAFGPFLAFGTVVALFYGKQILEWFPY